MNFNPAHWSYSALKKYENCPRQYSEIVVYKNYKDVFTSPKGDTGDRFHKSAEAFIKHGGELDNEFKALEPALNAVRHVSGEKHAEWKAGVSHDEAPLPWNSPDRWFQGIADLVIVNDSPVARVLDYKGLDIDTPIPTPTGFIRMADLEVGDSVFGTDGLAYLVTGKSEVKNLRCYEVVFTNGHSVVCDEEHLWGLTDGSVVNVLALAPRAKVPLTDAVEFPTAALPMDPYVLGFWLADGKHSSAEATKGDAFIWDEVVKRGYELGVDTNNHDTNCQTRTIIGIRKHLIQLNLLKNKHIPEIYKRASRQQRIDLVRGLMDGDGSVNKIRQQAIFTCTNKTLSDDLREVLESLGLRVLQSKAKYSGFGVEGVQYPLSFKPRSFNPFLLPRKAEAANVFRKGRDYLEVKEVKSVESRPTQCISVGSPNRMYLCGRGYIPTHNTGSAKYADTDQLELMALLVFAHYPHVKLVKGALLFVLENKMIPRNVDIKEKDRIWQKYREKDAKRLASYHSNNWPARSSGLCKKHCIVVSCEHNGRK
jgi:hypothetical protein